MSNPPIRKRSRLRWLTLAEIVAILAVAVSGLGLWKSWQDKEQPPVVAIADDKSIPLTLRATPSDDRRSLVVTAVEPSHALQSVAVGFPEALGLSTVEQSGGIELAASNIDDALFRQRDALKLAKLTNSETRLPLLVVTRYIEAGSPREDRAIYQLGYRIRDGGIFGGRELSLGGLSLVSRGKSATQAALDRRWGDQAR